MYKEILLWKFDGFAFYLEWKAFNSDEYPILWNNWM